MSKIDLHVHYLPPLYREALLAAGQVLSDGFPTPPWDAEEHVRMMDRQNIGTAFLSASSPHCSFTNENETGVLARRINECGGELVGRFPHRFGLLASLPEHQPARYIERPVTQSWSTHPRELLPILTILGLNGCSWGTLPGAPCSCPKGA
jgi:hypothetical protein